MNTIPPIPIIIAIDGPSSSGKSSFAKMLARALGYAYIDSGAMYRALTLHAIERGFIDAEGAVDRGKLVPDLENVSITFSKSGEGRTGATLLGGRDVETQIRTMAVSAAVSAVSEIPQVRAFLTQQQREFGRDRGLVMDGRDIGSVVFPDAELKVFLTASPEVRARRRFEEMRAKGCEADYDSILANIAHRDFIDEHRSAAPLRLAPDALRLDNSALTMEQQLCWAMERLAALQAGVAPQAETSPSLQKTLW